MNRPEEQVQRAIVQWLGWTQYPERGGVLWFAVPNQRGTRTRTEAAILKGLGVRPGVADLVIIAPGEAGAEVMFLEVKAPGRGRLSHAQEEFRDACQHLDADHHVVTSLEEAIALITAKTGG